MMYYGISSVNTSQKSAINTSQSSTGTSSLGTSNSSHTSNGPQQNMTDLMEEEVKEEFKPQMVNTSQTKQPESLLVNANLARCFAEMKNTGQNLLQIPPNLIPPGLTIEEITNPLDLEKSSLSFLNKFAEELEKTKGEFLAECRSKDHQACSQMWSKAFKQAQLLQMKMQEGQIDLGEYKTSLQDMLAKNKSLIEVYKSYGAKYHFTFTTKKMEMEESELKELDAMEQENA